MDSCFVRSSQIQWRMTSVLVAISLTLLGSFSGIQDLSSYTTNTTTTMTAIEEDRRVVPSKFEYDHANNTVVTAFYPLNSNRHSQDDYMLYMARLFSNDDPMIIFTSHDLAQKIRSMRGKPKRTLIIPMHLNETKAVQLFPLDFWKRNVPPKVHGIGSSDTNSYQVRVIWNSKIEFLKLGSDINPFGSKFFAWVDAGLIRWDDYANTTILQRVPPELQRDRFMVMNVTSVLFHKTYKQMAAGLFGGYKKAIDLYYEKYYQILWKTGNSTTTAPLLASEQVSMHNVCVETPGLCHVVTPRRSKCCSPALQQPYFYMLPYCNRKEFNAMKIAGIVHPMDGL
jgi:hypothetical protein